MLPDEVELEQHYKFSVKHDWYDYLVKFNNPCAANAVIVPDMFYPQPDRTLVKQLNDWYILTHGKSYSSYTKGIIAEIEKKLAKPKIYEFDFTQKLEWKVGSFGDKGSCFWGGSKNHRYSLQDYGCRAVRFYNGKKGVARAWAWPYGKHGLVLFNAYGYQLEKIAGILADFFQLAHDQVYIQNHGIHINNGIGRYIATQGLVNKTNSIELKVHQNYECIECHTRGAISKFKDYNNHLGICKKCYGSVFRCEECFTNLENAEIETASGLYRSRVKWKRCPKCKEKNNVCYYCEKPNKLGWYIGNIFSHYGCRNGPK